MKIRKFVPGGMIPACSGGVRTWLFLLLWWMGLSSLPAQTMEKKIDRLLADTLLSDSEVGIMVYDLTTSEVLYAYQAEKLYRPASVMKVLTAVTAMERLGNEAQMTTELYYTGTLLPDSTLKGDLYAVGGFDPTLSKRDVQLFARNVKEAGIKYVEGGIIGNVSMKDSLKWGAGWCWDDEMPPLYPLLCEQTDSFHLYLLHYLAEQGVTVGDSVMRFVAAAPDSVMTRIAVLERPLDLLLDRMMKKSDNLYAEALFYHLAAHAHRPYAGLEEGRDVMDSLIKVLGYNPKRYNIADGSGLSLYNYLSPQLLVSVLEYAYQNPAIYKKLRQSLPVSGVDGTLRNRMKKGKAYRRVHAKTGTLTGVCSLAGYADALNGHTLAFVIINQNELRLRPVRGWQDKVCEAIVSYGAGMK